jgi:hypothetical protein
MSYWTRSFNFDSFEQALAELYNVENVIYLARATRLAEADKKLTEAQSNFDEGHKLLGYECYIMSGHPGTPTDGDREWAKERADKVKVFLDAAYSLSNESVAIDGGHKTQTTALQNQIAADRPRQEKLKTVAHSHFPALLLAVGSNDCMQAK